MNKIMKSYLWGFFLVLFDDIHIYSKSWEAHVQHVTQVLHLLQDHRLFVKKFKLFIWSDISGIFGPYCGP